MSDLTSLEARTKEFLNACFLEEAKDLYLEFCKIYKTAFTLVSWDKLSENRKQFYINKAIDLYLQDTLKIDSARLESRINNIE